MNRMLNKLTNPSFILDIVQVFVAVSVAVILALDMTGLWSGAPWVTENISSITLIAVCTLIVSAFLERRVQLGKFIESTEKKLNKISDASNFRINLEDRKGYTITFEERFSNASNVELMGRSLGGILPGIAPIIRERAKAGCNFRILITDPEYFQTLEKSGYSSGSVFLDISLRILERLSKIDNIEIRFMKFPPNYSLLVIDLDKHHGSIQVELYTNAADTHKRPHFTLTQFTDKGWYEFYKNEFEKVWITSKPSSLIFNFQEE